MYNAMLEKKAVIINEMTFYIAPFPAMLSVRVSAALTKALSPVIGGVMALFGGELADEEKSMLDAEVTDAMPAFIKAMEGVNPSDWENTMRMLLLNSGNIVIAHQDCPEGEIMTEDVMNARFATDVAGLYRLAFEVVKLNFGSFFGKFSSLSGNPMFQTLQQKIK